MEAVSWGMLAAQLVFIMTAAPPSRRTMPAAISSTSNSRGSKGRGVRTPSGAPLSARDVISPSSRLPNMVQVRQLTANAFGFPISQ